MSEAATTRKVETATALARARCLLLQVEPTSYMLHRLERFVGDASFDYEVRFVTSNASQKWDIAGVDQGGVLSPREVSRIERWRRIAKLSAEIVRGRYSAAHLAGWGSTTLIYFAILLHFCGVPFTYESDTQLATDRTRIRERLKSFLYPLLFRLPAAFFPAGTRQADFFRAYGVAPERIHIGRMTVDVERIRALSDTPRGDHRAAKGFGADDVVFLFVGRLEEKKGLSYLIKAFAEAKASCERCHLVIVGDGSQTEQLRRAAAETLGVYCAGRQPFEAVIQWMKASDVLVLPSVAEPWGLVVNEAMACGLPIIATQRVGCVDDLVQDGVNGCVVPAEDSRALAAAMLALAGDDDKRAKMGTASEVIIAPWTLDAEANVMKQVLKSICKPA